MTLYAVKNAEGKWFGYEIYSSEPGWFENGGITWDYSGAAELTVHKHGGHVVELTEAPTKVMVSAEEAEMLERAKKPSFQETSVIDSYVTTHGGAEFGCDIGDRLMRAYVIGWVVAKPKQYLVKVKGRFERPTYYALRFNEYLAFGYREQDQQKLSDYPAYPFTDAEIIKYGLENCEKVEVSNKGEKDE